MLDGKSFPRVGCTPYVCNMCDGATLTRSGQFLGMKPTKKNCSIYKLCAWIDEGIHLGGAHGHDREPIVFTKTKCFWLWHEWFM
jgi:hypothetical protein